MADFHGGRGTGDFDVRWIHGEPGEALIQTHAYDEHTYLLRQSKTVTFEAPFLYLLFGNDRAILFDTGATKEPDRFPLRATVDGIVSSWLTAHPRDGYELVVAHTHSHGDHIAGDAQFADRPDTTVVPGRPSNCASAARWSPWPCVCATTSS